MECSNCTLCCKLLNITSKNSLPNEWCSECDIGNGCKIHDNGIPEQCSKFECAYYQMENVSINLRPDNCKVIFEKLDDIFFGTLHPDYELTNDAKGQIASFIKEGYSVIINSTKFKYPMIFPAKGKTAKQVFESYEERINGSSVIHN